MYGCNKRELHGKFYGGSKKQLPSGEGAKLTKDAKSSPVTFIGPFFSVLISHTVVLQPVREAFRGVSTYDV